MSVTRLLIPAVITLSLVTPSIAQNRIHRHAVWANRPYNRYATTTGYRGTPTTGDVQTLTQAYSTLASADHDYKGHRIKAMQAIKKAARLMGQKIAGDGHNKESQSLSDAQLKGVQQQLQKVRGSVSGGRQQLVVGHISEAIHHLSEALSIK
jgi:hypothetical protein